MFDWIKNAWDKAPACPEDAVVKCPTGEYISGVLPGGVLAWVKGDVTSYWCRHRGVDPITAITAITADPSVHLVLKIHGEPTDQILVEAETHKGGTILSSTIMDHGRFRKYIELPKPRVSIKKGDVELYSGESCPGYFRLELYPEPRYIQNGSVCNYLRGNSVWAVYKGGAHVGTSMTKPEIKDCGVWHKAWWVDLEGVDREASGYLSVEEVLCADLTLEYK